MSDGRGGTVQDNVTFAATPPFTTWVINTTDDDRNNVSAASSDVTLLDGVPLDGNGKISLRAVIEQANFNRFNVQYWPTAPIYVTFDPALDGQETVLGRSLDTIQANVVFIGRGETQTLIAGNLPTGGYNTQGIFRFASGSTSAVIGMTLERGFTTDPGGAVSIANGASVFLDSDTIKNNSARNGGGIYSNGYVATINSSISDNHATSTAAAASGGGLHVEGGYFVSSRSSFANNDGQSKGGGIAVNGTGNAFIYSTNILDNQGTEGGGIYLSGGPRLVLQNSVVTGNSATAGRGGGIIVEGRASIRETDFDRNTATGDGGAIIYRSGSLTLEGCIFGDNNTAANGPKLAAANGTRLTDASGNNINFDPVTDIFWFS